MASKPPSSDGPPVRLRFPEFLRQHITNPAGRKLFICLGFALLVAGGAIWLTKRPSRVISHTYRIGVDNAPPISEPGPDGKPIGFAVEVMNEAARRRHISLEWVTTKLPSDEALRSGFVDFWPVVGITNARRRIHHLTEPWFC